MHLRFPGLAIAAALLAASPTVASAHAVVLTTAPADGAVLDLPPEAARIVFNEPVELLSLRLVAPGGNPTVLDATVINGSTISATLPDNLGTGTHALSWRVISSDGHPLSGSIIFSVGSPTGEIVGADRDLPLSIAIWIARAVFYVGLFIGAGGSAFGGWAGQVPAEVRKYLWTALIAGVAASIAGVGLQGADALGLGFAGLNDAQSWSTGTRAGFGLQATLGVAAMTLGALGLSIRKSGLGLAVALATIAFVGAAIAATGHASTAEPQWLTRPATFVHASAIAFWIGALLPLVFLVVGGESEPLRRFSQAIPLGVLALLASGLVLVFVQLGPPSASWLSPYGFVLASKLALVAAILILALRNRYLLTSRVLAGDAVAARKLRSSVVVETSLVLLVFLAVAGWRFTPPPRALAEADFVPAATFAHVMQAGAMAEIALLPGGQGGAELTLMLSDSAQLPLEAQEVSVRLSEAHLGIEPFRRTALREGPGLWRVLDIDLPSPGAWQLQVEILVSDFVVVTLQSELQVERQ